MTGFKDYLAEIMHDDSIYSKKQSDVVVKHGGTKEGGWLPLRLKTPIEGVECFWKKKDPHYLLKVVMNGEPVIYAEMPVITVQVPGGILTGVEVFSLSSAKEVRGTGLVQKIYEALIESGQVLFSANLQTTGSRRLWERLVERPTVVPFVLARFEAAEWYINRYKADHSANVLLTGPIQRLIDEAYAHIDTRWVALPKDLEGIDRLREGAIDIT